jgi:AraC-like DNA-binding protein
MDGGDIADNIRLALSLIVIGQQVLVALLLVRDRPRVRPPWFGVGLMLGSIAYLILSNHPLSEASQSVRPLLIALAIAIPYLLWEFAAAVFEFGMALRIRLVIYAVPLLTWSAIILEPASLQSLPELLGTINRVLSLIVVTHAAASALLGLKNDLLEQRRRYRLLFVLLIGVQVTAILVVELLSGGEPVTASLELLNVGAIAVLTLGLSLPLLAVRSDLIWEVDEGQADVPEVSDDWLPAERLLNNKLDQKLREGIYRTTGISIGQFADALEVPEHQLRKLINQRLGYRNFNAFLNRHRVEDAKSSLSDPEKLRIPILTIALELGYGSIGPFNRAFKQATGNTPSEYRRRQMRDLSADSEKL